MSANKTKHYKCRFWDDVNKRYYRWHDLMLLLQERELKKKNETKQN